MFGWLRRGGSDNPGETGWSTDPAPTPDERRDELLSAYLDDDLTAGERTELEARLETDAALREDLDGMRTVRDTLATLEVVRAPRSFAITAPAAPARRGFRPFDLATRVGAMAAAVAFVAVLAGDLSGGGTPIAQDTAANSVAAEASGGALGEADDGAAADTGTNAFTQGASAPAPIPEDGSDDTSTGTTDQPPADSTPEAPVLDEDVPGQPVAEATAARSATEPPADAASSNDSETGPADSAGVAPDEAAGDPAPSLPPNSGGSIEPAADQSPESAIEEGADSSLDPDADTLELAQPSAAAGDVERVDDGSVEGTPDPVASLGTQSAETSAAADAEGANELVEDGREVSGLAIGLGMAAAALAAMSGVLWWRRRAGAAGPH